MSIVSDILSGLGTTGQNIAAGAIGTGALASIMSGYNRLGDIGNTAYDRSRDIARQGLEQSEFKPFTVRSSTGGMFSADSGGNVGMSLGGQ